MYFVTNEPMLFNAETGFTWCIKPDNIGGEFVEMDTNICLQTVYTGTRQQCEDFILGMAGRLDAFNPEVKAAVPENTAPPSFEWGACYSIDEIIAKSYKHEEFADSGREYILAQAHDEREHRFVWIPAHKGWNNTSSKDGVPTSSAANKLAMQGRVSDG